MDGRVPGLRCRKRRLSVNAPGPEERVVGACLRHPGLAARVVRILDPSDLKDPVLAAIFDAICTLVSSGQRPDPISVASRLHGTWVAHVLGGHEAVLEKARTLEAQGPDEEAAILDATCLRDLAVLRKASRIGTRLLQLSDGKQATRSAVQAVESLLREAWVSLSRGQAPVVSNAEAAEESEAIILGLRKPPCVTTGFSRLDAVLGGGMRAGELTLLAGRTKMGKSAVAGHMVLACAMSGIPVFVATLEMPTWQWHMRWVAALTGIPVMRLAASQLTEPEVSMARAALRKVRDVPVHWMDRRGVSLRDVASEVGRWASSTGKHGLVVLDHIGLLAEVVSGRDPVKDLGDAAKTLRALAQTTNTAILAISQLSREVERQPGRRPQLHHLRASGELEQDADVVLLLYRDSYYYRPGTPIDRTTGEPARTPSSDSYRVLPDAAEIIVAANRNGPSMSVPIRFNPATCYCGDWPREAQFPSPGEGR